MERFSVEVENRIVRALGAYLRATPKGELPAPIRRFATFGPKALLPHRDVLMSAFDDAGLRARIVEWIDDGKTPLKKDERELLRSVASQTDGWADALRESEPRAVAPPKPRTDDGALAREKEKVRRARDELQKAKAGTTATTKKLESKLVERDRAIAELRARLKEAEVRTTAAERALEQAQSALERERRKHERDLAKASADKDKLQADAKAAKKEARDLASSVRRLERELTAERAKASRPRDAKTTAPRRRTALAVPKGRMADAPETLEEWLAAPRVHLLIDGYNVTKAEGGFGDLRLESQRERLIDEIGRLARKHSAKATIVFDGADVPPGTSGVRRRSPVKIEYSRPPEIGDDHLVGTLESLPPDPVVVVTNDRELQGRVADLGATVATSNQLLRLIR